MSVRRNVSLTLWIGSVSGFSLFLIVCFSDRALQRADAASAPTVVAEATRALDSPSFADREAASKRLVEAEGNAVPAVLNVAKEGSLEAAARSVWVLEAIYIAADRKSDGATIDAAEFGLDELTRTGRPAVADRAEVVLETHYDIRERRAIAEIHRLHGRPVFGMLGEPPIFGNGRLNPAGPPNDAPRTRPDGHAELTMVIIGPKWQGGDEGLKQVARLKRLHMLYRIEGKQVSDEGIARLRAAVPGLEVQIRGAAKLGITTNGPTFTNGHETGCQIDRVVKGEAAANAGLSSHDVILRFNGQTVESFDNLIELLRSHKPGDTVEMLIRRDETTLTVPVRLTGWD